MEPICKNPLCGLRHPTRWNCARAAFEAKKQMPTVMVETPLVETQSVVETRHGRHKDAEAHRIKMREFMKLKRAHAKTPNP